MATSLGSPQRRAKSSRLFCNLAAVGTATVLLAGMSTAAHASAASYPSDSTPPDLITLLSGYNQFWTSDGLSDLHGTVLDAKTLERNDKLTVWINNNASKAQQFHALQDSEYNNATNTAYDQSLTISTGLGSILGPLYVKGTESGALPLTQALINSSDGTTGAYVSTKSAKANFSYPRPYLAVNADATPVAGDAAGCAPSVVNGSSLKSIRVGRSYADANGDLKIKRLADVTDTTHEFSPNDVALSVGYGTTGLCTGGSFPSGHTTTAYQAAITLATLLPELAPQILARGSEAGNDRIVLGVHYPLDIMGGRIDGEAALATRWSDTEFRTDVLEPARAELIKFLQAQTGKTLAQVIAAQKPYTDNPYGGKKMPGGTAQIVTNEKSAVSVYTERLTYGFAPVGNTKLAPSVPAGAENLLLTAYPSLTDAQRTSVLAQTEIASGFPLEGSTTASGSWERLNLAAALSATVRINRDGSVTVLKTGGPARVIAPRTATLSTNGGSTVAAGSAVTLSGNGFVAGQPVSLVLYSKAGKPEADLGTATADLYGKLRVTVTIPAGTTPGGYQVDALYGDDGCPVLRKPLWIKVTPSKS